MKQYMTYEDYTELGGTVEESAFPYLLRKAQRKLDFYTQDRVKNLDVIPDEVKETLVEFMNILKDCDTDGVSSYSNGTESFSYAQVDKNQKLYSVAKEYLPLELISLVVD